MIFKVGKFPVPIRSVCREESITDWYIPENTPELSFVYPGPYDVKDGLVDIAKEILCMAKSACYLRDAEDINSPVIEIVDDYRIKFKDRYLRGHRQLNVDGVMHILRVIPEHVPLSKNLGMPEQVRQILIGKKFGESGGLIIVCGATGQGKSTTCASIILERVKQFGSFCFTVEDPPEFALSGQYEAENDASCSGRIIQVQVKKGDFSFFLKEALRCYPADSKGSILFIGEVRDEKSANQVLNAASAGQLVFMTTHSVDIVSAIERFLSFCNSESGSQNESAEMLSSCLKAVIHQTLSNGKLNITSLFAGKPDSVIANCIRAKNIRSLSSEINRQEKLLGNGGLESYVINQL